MIAVGEWEDGSVVFDTGEWTLLVGPASSMIMNFRSDIPDTRRLDWTPPVYQSPLQILVSLMGQHPEFLRGTPFSLRLVRGVPFCLCEVFQVRGEKHFQYMRMRDSVLDVLVVGAHYLRAVAGEGGEGHCRMPAGLDGYGSEVVLRWVVSQTEVGMRWLFRS